MAEKQPTKGIITFPKDKLLQSLKYANRKDVLNVVLEDGKEYSFEEVDKRINAFMKRKDGK